MFQNDLVRAESLMNDVVNEYCIHERGHGNFPLVELDSADAMGRFYRGALDATEVTPLRLASPRLKRPEMADYLSLPIPPVVSSTIRDVLEPLNLPCTQFAPATIRRAPPHDKQYWVLHNYLELDVMDLEASVYKISAVDPSLFLRIDDFRLSATKLGALPVDARLLFRDFRTQRYLFWHKSLRDLVMMANPTGIAFSRAHGRTPADAFR